MQREQFLEQTWYEEHEPALKYDFSDFLTVLSKLRSMKSFEPASLSTISKRIDVLEEEVNQLKNEINTKRTLSFNKGDLIYELHREELEKEHWDKIVAIDVENKIPVGFGKTVSEAYLYAKIKEPNQSQFYFRKVGKNYITRL